MTSNLNPDTGVFYGYIRADHLDPDQFNSLQYIHGRDVNYADALAEYKREHKGKCLLGTPMTDDEIEEEFSNGYQPDEPVYEGEVDGVKYRTSWMGGAQHVFVFQSPVKWNCRPCSLCVPNAGNLDQAGDGEYEAYGLPSIWMSTLFLEERINEHGITVMPETDGKYFYQKEDTEEFKGGFNTYEGALEAAFEELVLVKEEVS